MKIYNNIAVALKYKSFNLFWEDFKKAMETEAKIVEIRFDYSEQLDLYFSKKKDSNNDYEISLEDIRNIFPKSEIDFIIQNTKIPLIFTLRANEEGGNLEIPETSRQKIIHYLMSFKPDYFDLESRININSLTELYIAAKENGIRLILSYHNWFKTPSYEKIKEIIEKILSQYKEIEPDYSLDQYIVKAIFTANHPSDNNAVLKICKFYAEKNIKIICFCMGVEGIPSRVGSLLCGAFMSYASISAETAPGQLNIEDFFELYDKINQKID